MENRRVFHRHWITILIPAIAGLLGIPATLSLAVICATGRADWLVMVPSACCSLWAIWRLVQWHRYYIVFTADGRAVCHTGILVHQTSAPLHVYKVDTRSGLIGRILDYGTLEIGTNPLCEFDRIERFSEVQRILVEGPDAWQPRNPPVGHAPRSTAPQPMRMERQARREHVFATDMPSFESRLRRAPTGSRYRRFLSLCRQLMKGDPASRRQLFRQLTDEEWDFMVVLIRTRLFKKEGLCWAKRIRTLDDVRQRIGPKQLTIALQSPSGFR